MTAVVCVRAMQSINPLTDRDLRPQFVALGSVAAVTRLPALEPCLHLGIEDRRSRPA